MQSYKNSIIEGDCKARESLCLKEKLPRIGFQLLSYLIYILCSEVRSLGPPPKIGLLKVRGSSVLDAALAR